MIVASSRASRRVSKSLIGRRFYAGLLRCTDQQHVPKNENTVNQKRSFSVSPGNPSLPIFDARSAESRRFFSSPVKNPASQEAEQSKPDAADKTSPAGPPKGQGGAVPAAPKTATQQSMQKPSVKPAQTQAAGTKPVAPSTKPQISQGAGPATGAVSSQKTQVTNPATLKPQAAQGGVRTAPPVSKVAPQAGQKVQAAAATPSKTSSKIQVILASAAVGSLVLGLFYWQFPRIHDGATDQGDKGKDASDTGVLAEKQSTEANGAPAVQTPVPNDTDGTEKEKEIDGAAASVVLEPDGVKVLVESPDVEHSQKHENETGQTVEEKTPNVVEERVPSEEIVVEVVPDSDEEVSITVNKPEAEEARITIYNDDVVVSIKDGNKDISESFLIQRGHENFVQKQEAGDLAASDGSDVAKQGLDVVAAIHAAEHKQAEIDAHIFKERLQLLQEMHEKELTEKERKASSFQEQVDRLRESLENEKRTHDVHLRQQQEEADFKLQGQLKLKEEEIQRQLEEVELRAKSEAAAALTQERASFLKDIGSAKVHVLDLQMEAINAALEAKSAEAREGHEIKQLSLGTFALEDALLSGAPIHKEAESLLKSAGGDPLVELAVVTLPKEVLEAGTLTPGELDQSLKEIEGALRELALIPPGGGGVLVHLMARLASLLKLPDRTLYLDSGVDAVLSRVQDFVKSGKLLDAAELLSLGMSGTNADKLAGEWATQARNRAIAEQACALLRAHAAAMALSDRQS